MPTSAQIFINLLNLCIGHDDVLKKLSIFRPPFCSFSETFRDLVYATNGLVPNFKLAGVAPRFRLLPENKFI